MESSKINSYRDLIIWQKSILNVTEIYRLTKNFPKEEQFGLISQMRRSAISIPSNIAEGFGRNYQGEFKRFLNISLGSLFELQTQVEISLNLNYLSSIEYESIMGRTTELEKMINSLASKIKSKS